MSKLVYVCLRDASGAAATATAVATIVGRLRPDNLPKMPPRMLVADGIVAGVSSPADLVAVRGQSLAAGYLLNPGAWERPRTSRPDGAYALFRSDEAVVEIVSDLVASRTVWYAMNDQLFVASTSQRAIVALLGSFHFNEAVIPWMLVNGTLGPGLSWDKRIRCVPGATSLVLDRKRWMLHEQTEPVRFAPDPAPDSEHQHRAVGALRHAIGAAHVADPRWAISLSGGADCRAILCCLEDIKELRAVTWGLRAARRNKSSDAYIAKQLAAHFCLQHYYFETDLSAQPPDRVFERFVAYGEGRIDHISGYTDGFELWGNLVRNGVHGIVRGDHAFGRPAVRNSLEVRTKLGILSWSDIPGLPPLNHFDLPAQQRPGWLEQGVGESLETWRDRIQQQYRIPFSLAALSDLKLSYVEIINPLLSNSIIELVRRLPDSLRTGKLLLRRVASILSPDIPFASGRATQPLGDILRSRQFVDLLHDNLSENAVGTAVPRQLAAHALVALTTTPVDLRSMIPKKLRRMTKYRPLSWAFGGRTKVIRPPQVNGYRLAFRTYMLSRASRLFSDDAAFLRQGSDVISG